MSSAPEQRQETVEERDEAPRASNNARPRGPTRKGSEPSSTASSRQSPPPPPQREQAEVGQEASPSSSSAEPFTTELGPTAVETIAGEDLLGREKITAALAGLLAQRDSTDPLSIGLFGHWGSGKSSQVAFVRAALAALPAPRFVHAEFNAWRHERSENLGAALAQSVVEPLIRDLGFFAQLGLAARMVARRHARLRSSLQRDVDSLRVRAANWFHAWAPLLFGPLCIAALIVIAGFVNWESALAKAGSIGAALGVAVLGLQKFVSTNLTGFFKALTIEQPLSAFALPDYSTKLGSAHEIGRTLEELCAARLAGNDAAPGEGDYLLLVVDDLDRCSPKTVKQVFDAVRLVTHLPRVVVMILIDERIAFAAVEKHYEEFGYAGRSPAQVARDYLGKVFQVSLTLPLVDATLARSYVKRKLFGAAADAAGSDAAAPPAPGPRAAAAVPSATVASWEVQRFADLAEATGLVNPRQLWRLKQAWLLLRALVLTPATPQAEAKDWLRRLFETERRLQDYESPPTLTAPGSPAAPALSAADTTVRAVLLPTAP